MENLFVPYQQSVDMMGIGFDEPCFTYYCTDETLSVTPTENGDDIKYPGDPKFDYHQNSYLNDDELCSAPTFSQAFAWFREKHGLNGNIGDVYGDFDAWSFAIAKKGKGMIVPFRTDDTNYNTYPEAELACLIRLIEIVKSIVL